MTIGYNVLNLPNSISKSSESIAYIYSAAGEKVAKRMKDNSYLYYGGSMVYNNDKSLKYILFEEGMVNKSSGAYTSEYHLKDHLGNTRVAFQPYGYSTITTQVAEYYPFGSSYLPLNPAGTNKYLYNGKEKQDDVLGGTALDEFDYGARFYDPSLGRWHSIDNKAEKYSFTSPYTYALNNPIKFLDPDGNEVYISITTQAVGTTQLRLIGSESVNGAPSTVKVPIYNMIVTDDVTGTSSSYLVTRDGPMIDQDDPENSDNTYNVDNFAFEPQSSNGDYKGVPLDYPEGMGAYAIRNKDGSDNLKAVPNNSPFRQKKDEAKGVMIHVGGQYTDSKGRQRITGSEGCFSLAGKDSGNKGIKKLTNDIYKRQQANKKANKGSDINIKVEKRKKVDNEWDVDKNGNKTK